MVGQKYQIVNAYSFIDKKKLFSSVYMDDIKMAGKKQNLAPLWKKLMKNVDIEEPTSFLDHVLFRMHSSGMQTKRENH